ncbi:MAG TPA: peptidoglycan DD-metalloendopeptidase family protein [Burkholderiales bacterium]
MKATKAALTGLLAALLGACAGTQSSAPVVDRTARVGGVELKPAIRPEPRPAPQAAPAAQPAPEGFYMVKRGDTLYSIALEAGVDYRELAQWNQLDDPTRIRVGQLLRVKPEPSQAVTIGRMNDSRVESRPLDPPVAVIAPQPLPKAPAQKEAPAPREEPAAPPSYSGGTAEFVWPAKGKILTGFSEPRSKGIDIDGKLGDPVVAAAAGRVTYIGSGIPGLGKLVVIKHDNGFITVYAHNRNILVKEQQSVARGERIAELGASDADRPKLHFQIRKGSAAVDPLRYLPAL